MLNCHCVVHCIVKLYTIIWLLSDILAMVWKYLFMLFIPGHRTFPRSSMMNRRPELNSTFRSFMSRGSEGTLSTSSSSSGYPPDPEDSPDGRMFKRSSAEGSPSFNPAFSKCKYKYILWEHSGSVVECLTWDWGAVVSNLTDVTVLFPWALLSTGSTQLNNCWLGR